MQHADSELNKLSDALILEIVNAIGLPKTRRVGSFFRPIFHKPAARLATISLTADRLIETDGFPAAATWMLTNWCDRVSSRGSEAVPQTGPLLVISNHAGSYDTFVIASTLERRDLKLISSDVPFLKNLPNASSHIIFLSDRPGDRMIAARAGIRHLKDGGSLLLYATGLIDPDPEVYPGAEAWLDKWLPSIDLFLRTIPETNVILSIVSGVVAKRWAHHPITRLTRVDWQQRRLAEFSQVIQQLYSPGRLFLQPHISLSAPFNVKDLGSSDNTERLLPSIITRGKELLAEHMAWIHSTPGK